MRNDHLKLVYKLCDFKCFAQILWSEYDNLLLFFSFSHEVLYCRVYSTCLRLIYILL